MIFTLLTFATALLLAAVSGWFSIIGVMAIYAGAPIHALIMGITLEIGKLVTTSWLYRNWKGASWFIKTPLIIFTFLLMVTTSIGVFGFLSKAHIEQNASTVDNSAKVERLDQQIAREKSVISDNEKVITQLDATVNSYLGKDRIDKSVAIRKSQDVQRKQLRIDIETAQTAIDKFSDEKLKLQSEVRKLQLDVGPVRYIAELFFGVSDKVEQNIEAAVKIFTGIIVSTMDPLAVILLIAANYTLLRYKNEEKTDNVGASRVSNNSLPIQTGFQVEEDRNQGPESHAEVVQEENSNLGDDRFHGGTILGGRVEYISTRIPEIRSEIQENILDEDETPEISNINVSDAHERETRISCLQIWPSEGKKYQDVSSFTDILDEKRAPLSEINEEEEIILPQVAEGNSIIPEEQLILSEEIHINGFKTRSEPGTFTWPKVPDVKPSRHFIPQPVNGEIIEYLPLPEVKTNKYPSVLSWLNEFKGAQDGK